MTNTSAATGVLSAGAGWHHGPCSVHDAAQSSEATVQGCRDTCNSILHPSAFQLRPVSQAFEAKSLQHCSLTQRPDDVDLSGIVPACIASMLPTP